METIQASNGSTPCEAPLPDLEIPMITTLVSCLRSEHKRLDILNLQLALAATRLARDPEEVTAKQRALELWDEVRRVLWSHLQIENGLVLSWGQAHKAIAGPLLDAFKGEFEQMRNAVTALTSSSSVVDSRQGELGDRGDFARTLLVFTQALDSHLERYEREVLPSILRAVLHDRPTRG